MHDPRSNGGRSSDTRVTRRRVLAGAGSAVVAGGGLFALAPDDASAEVTMGDFSLSGADANVTDAPAAIDVRATGEWQVDAPSPPEQVQTTLQIEVNGTADDLATDAGFDASAGAFDLEADLLDHRDVTADDLTPADPGATKTTDVTVRVIVSAVRSGEVVAEASVDGTKPLTLTRDGMVVSVGGEATMDVVTD